MPRAGASTRAMVGLMLDDTILTVDPDVLRLGVYYLIMEVCTETYPYGNETYDG